MNFETHKNYFLAAVIIVGLYGIVVPTLVSKDELALATAPTSDAMLIPDVPDHYKLSGWDEDPLWFLSSGVSPVETDESSPLEPVVANVSADLLSQERARIVSELNSRREGLRRWVGGEIDRTEQKIEALDSRIESILPSLTPALRNNITTNNHDKVVRMIYPVVQLRGNGTVGSGVVLSCEFAGEQHWKTWIVTAYHVVEEVRDLTSEEVVIRELRFFDPEHGRLDEVVYDGFEVASLPESDLSLIRVDRATAWPYTAIVAAESVCNSLSVFEPVYAVGCPLGNQPLPTLGQISSQYKPVGGEIYWMVNAPTYFGNSGGGIFRAKDSQLIGISSMIYTYGKRSPMVVPHMGLFVPFQTVRSWLRREGFAYLIRNPQIGPVPASDSSGNTGNGVSGSF